MKRLALALLICLASCSMEPSPLGHQPAVMERSCTTREGRTETAAAIGHGRHWGILLSTTSLSGMPPRLPEEFQRFAYVEIGWGDRDYYMGTDDSLSGGFQALFFSNAAVLHVAGFDNEAALINGLETVRLKTSADGYRRLLALIELTFDRDERGNPVPLGPSLYGHGHFYAAKGSFSWSNTCNTWVSQLLKAAGCEVHEVITASALLAEIHRLPRT